VIFAQRFYKSIYSVSGQSENRVYTTINKALDENFRSRHDRSVTDLPITHLWNEIALVPLPVWLAACVTINCLYVPPRQKLCSAVGNL